MKSTQKFNKSSFVLNGKLSKELRTCVPQLRSQRCWHAKAKNPTSEAATV